LNLYFIRKARLSEENKPYPGSLFYSEKVTPWDKRECERGEGQFYSEKVAGLSTEALQKEHYK